MKTLRILALGALALSAQPEQAKSYSGEDVLDGLPFHHFDLTFRALAGDAAGQAPEIIFDDIGFTRKAAYAIAWHADYIDSYLYSPTWWAEPLKLQRGNFKTRIKGAFSAYPELLKLHFDDTFTTKGIEDNWRRYGSGTLAGLEWARKEGDLAAAYNILGVSVHAVQDFYSHSNWIDAPERRVKTWLETDPDVRSRYNLYSGSYELPSFSSQHSHGKIALDCSITGSKQIEEVLDTVCTAISPFSNAAFCESHRHCKDGVNTTLNFGGTALNNTIILNPPGIGLDSSLLGPIAAHQRGILNSSGEFNPNQSRNILSLSECTAASNFGVDCESKEGGRNCTVPARRSCTTPSDRVFATAKLLALRETQNWITQIKSEFTSLGSKQRDFWADIEAGASGTSFNSRVKQFEDFAQLPFQFLSVGPYPVANNRLGVPKFDNKAGPTGDGYYVRLDIDTENNATSGTDADISVTVLHDRGAEKFILDYMPTNDADAGIRANRLIAYNDFESDDRAIYTVGPIPRRPTGIFLNNEARNTGEILEALGEDFVQVMGEMLEGLRTFGLSLIAGNADYVGETLVHVSFNDLKRLARNSEVIELELNAGSEGHYIIVINVFETAEKDINIGTARREAGWESFARRIKGVEVIKESTHDKFTPSDEPFFFVAFTPLNGDAGSVSFSRFGPMNDMNTGDKRLVDKEKSGRVRFFNLPPQGSMTISMQQFESDSEAKSDRDLLYKKFKDGIFGKSDPINRKFADALGTALGTEWEIDKVRAFVFYRGERLEFGKVLSDGQDHFLDGGESHYYPFDTSNIKTLFRSGDDPARWHVRK